MNLWVVNIGELVVVPPGPVAGSRMGSVRTIAIAELRIEDGRIAAFGPAGSLGQVPADTETIDAQGGCYCSEALRSWTMRS